MCEDRAATATVMFKPSEQAGTCQLGVSGSTGVSVILFVAKLVAGQLLDVDCLVSAVDFGVAPAQLQRECFLCRHCAFGTHQELQLVQRLNCRAGPRCFASRPRGSHQVMVSMSSTLSLRC